MAEELKYTSGYDGATTDDLLGYAQEAKELDSNAYVKESKELKSNEYVLSMKEQTTAEDAETVQVFDVNGVPHKITKKELISKAGIQLPSLEEIGGFVAYDTNGQVLGLMSKEQVAQVVGELLKNKTFAESIGGLWNNNEIYDLNDSLTTGLYVAKANNETDNSPSQDSCLVAVLSDANYSMQLAVTLNLDNIYFRRIVKYTQRYGEWIILK